MSWPGRQAEGTRTGESVLVLNTLRMSGQACTAVVGEDNPPNSVIAGVPAYCGTRTPLRTEALTQSRGKVGSKRITPSGRLIANARRHNNTDASFQCLCTHTNHTLNVWLDSNKHKGVCRKRHESVIIPKWTRGTTGNNSR